MSSIPWRFPDAPFLARARAVVPTLRHYVRGRVLSWARRRQGGDSHITRLTGGRVYILPTGVGMVFALMAFAMLLGSMNYNNNLSFGLTFLLVSLGFVSMHFCQRTLVGIDVSFAGVEPVFAGQIAEFRIAVSNQARNRRFQLQVYSEGHESEIADIGPGDSHVFTVEVPAAGRGYVRLPRFGIRSLFPFELFRAWSWLHMDLSALVYPRPAENPPEPPPTRTARGHRQHDARGEEDFAGLRRFHDGDSPRQIAWKAYARSGDLLSKRFSGADTSSQWLDYAELEGIDREERLSRLTRWIVDADRLQRDYGLRLPGVEFPPAHGAGHRHRCLEALALFGDGEAGNGA